MKFSSKTLAVLLLLTLVPVALAQSAASPGVQSSLSSLACGLGTSWTEQEGGLPSTWTRRGTSNVFDASYPTARVTTVNTITTSGNKVYITRTNGSDGNSCFYEGTVGPDGETITGTYKCLNGSASWNARVNCNSSPLSANPPQELEVKRNAAVVEKVLTDSAGATERSTDKISHETKAGTKDAVTNAEKVPKKINPVLKKGSQDTGSKSSGPVKPQQQ
jgi:hypothetical protein